MKAEDILTNTDPEELRNLLWRLRQQVEGALLPPPTEIINEAPDQFPPLPSDTGFDLGWTNVKDHGALGDGTHDDTQAITNAINALPATGGVLYFPPGSYLTSGGFTLAVDVTVMGMGNSRYDTPSSTYISRILCSSVTASLFTVTANHALFKDLTLVNNAGSTPSAGAGITVTSSNVLQSVDYEGVYIYGFYIDVDVQVGVAWTMRNCILHSPVLYGLKIRNTIVADAGDWAIINSVFAAATYGPTAGIRIESSGGGKISNCKVNGTNAAQSFEHGIDLSSTVSGTGILIVSNCSIENVHGHGIRVTGTAWHSLLFYGIQFGLSWNTANDTGNGININGTFDSVVIADCVFAGGTTPAAISLTSVSNAKVVGNVNRSFSSLITQASCTDIIVIEPGTAVVTETSYGQASAVGTSGYYARQDHTHGSPALSTATPAEVGSSGAAGSGSTSSKNDHVHKGVHSVNGLYGDVTVSAGDDISHTHGLMRWNSSGGATFEFPDVVDAIEGVLLNGLEEDPLLYSLSSDRTQLVFDSATTAGDIVISKYVLAQV